jgi:hypothetical protein
MATWSSSTSRVCSGGEHIAANLKKEKSTIFVHYGLLQMLVPVPVRAELAPAPALDRAGEVADQAREWEWAKRPVRRRLGNTGVQTLTPSVDAGSIAQMTGTPFLFSLSDLYCTIFMFSKRTSYLSILFPKRRLPAYPFFVIGTSRQSYDYSYGINSYPMPMHGV